VLAITYELKLKNNFMKNVLLNATICTIVLFIISCKKDSIFLQGGQIKFIKNEEPVWNGYLVAGDPSIIKDGDIYKIYYTSLVVTDTSERIVISGAKSFNGINWMPMSGAFGSETIALDTRVDNWDKHLEANDVIKDGSEIKMFYCGYPKENTEINTTVAHGEIGLATSIDGKTFSRVQSNLILTRGSQNAMDNNALFSPTVMKEGNTYYMLYTGWCIDSCSTPFIGILGATSADGLNWTKNSDKIIAGTDSDLSWIQLLIEVDLVKGPDNIFYLFFTGEGGIGIARSNHPFGPWEIYPRPILTKTQAWESYKVIAPTVIIENNKARMWYMGARQGFSDFAIGYAESPFPFDW